MNIQPEDLLPGEKLLLSKGANAVIQLQEHGLKRLPADELTRLIGFRGKEAIGGKLHLTSFRLLFKSHAVNRLRGQFSIFLPTIVSAVNSSRLLVRRITVTTASQNFEFVIWGGPAVIAEISRAKEALDGPSVAEVRRLATEEHCSSTEGLDRFSSLDAFVRSAPAILKLASDPLSLANVVSLLDFVATEHEET